MRLLISESCMDNGQLHRPLCQRVILGPRIRQDQGVTHPTGDGQWDERVILQCSCSLLGVREEKGRDREKEKGTSNFHQRTIYQKKWSFIIEVTKLLGLDTITFINLKSVEDICSKQSLSQRVTAPFVLQLRSVDCYNSGPGKGQSLLHSHI